MPLNWQFARGRIPGTILHHALVHIRTFSETREYALAARRPAIAAAYAWGWQGGSTPRSPSHIVEYALAEEQIVVSPWHERDSRTHAPDNFPRTAKIQVACGRNAATTRDTLGINHPASLSRICDHNWEDREIGAEYRIVYFRIVHLSTEEAPRELVLTPEQQAHHDALAPWGRREYMNLFLQRYTPPPWHSEPWAQHPPTDARALHFPHISQRQSGLLAYSIAPPADAASSVKVPIKPGRYLQRFYADTLTPEEIKSWAARVRGEAMTLHFTNDINAYRDVYARAGAACMSHSAAHYSVAHTNGGQHPLVAYAASPDLRLAFITPADKTSCDYARGRAIVWPERKAFARVYGDNDAMIEALQNAGYHSAPLDGARLGLIPAGTNHYTCPYIDHIKWARVVDGHLVLQERATDATHSVQHGDGYAHPIDSAPKRPVHPQPESVWEEHTLLCAIERGDADPRASLTAAREALTAPPPPTPSTTRVTRTVTARFSNPGTIPHPDQTSLDAAVSRFIAPHPVTRG